MKKLLVLAFLIPLTNLTFAQQIFQDVIYLKNGSIIRGTIIEQIPNKSIKIETADKNVFVYEINEIDKITKEPLDAKSMRQLDNIVRGTGYNFGLELAFDIGVGYYGLDRLKLNVINGYQINEYIGIGFGTGFRYYFDAESVVMPFFIDIRGNMLLNNIYPFASIDLGYSFDLTDGFAALGFMLSPVLGVGFGVSDNVEMSFGFGYEMQKVDLGSFYYGDVNTGAISIVWGLLF